MANVYQMVTDRIVEQMKEGIIPWQQPWAGGSHMAINYESRKIYSHLNQLLLGKGGEWLTWKQIEKCKGKVKKGAKSRFVVYYQRQTKTEEDTETGEVRVKESHPILKWYRVFHINDTEGIETKIGQVTPNPNIQPIEKAEQVANDYVAREKGLSLVDNRESAEAYYALSTDTVVVPHITQYEIPEEYYSTLFHELTHSTMTEGRCNRKADSNIKRFGDNDYSREELVAEQRRPLTIFSGLMKAISDSDFERVKRLLTEFSRTPATGTREREARRQAALLLRKWTRKRL